MLKNDKPLLPTALALATALALSACAVTRVASPAPVQAPAQFKEDGLWQHARPQQAVPDDWWTLFDDPVLDDLQQRLVIGNENLKIYAAQLASARATLDASRTALFPTLSLGLSGTRSGSSSSDSSSSSSTAKSVSNSVSLSASASWEMDLWGKLAMASDGAQASLQASADDLAAARLSAQATLAQSYFALRTAEAQLALYERTVQAYQRSLALTEARYQSGVAARSDVLQAQTQLRSAQATRAETQATRAQLEHAIAVLLGQPPAALNLDASARLPAPPAVPALLPATLLERRPDIAAAQRRLAAAYADIGVADAAFFPSLTLSASGGYKNSSLNQLISAPHQFWSLGPSLAASLFDGGARKLASAQARATADQLGASYRLAVLTALQEVEDNLVLAKRLEEEADLQQQALEAAQQNLQIVTAQYKAGTVGFLEVASAQASALSSETSLLSLRNRQLAALSQLLKNIAGRWTPV